MSPLSPNPDSEARDRARTKVQIAYLLVLLGIFSFQAYLMARFIPTYLAVYCPAPGVYMHVKKIIDTIMNMWVVMLMLALFNPIVQLVGVYVRAKRRKLMD